MPPIPAFYSFAVIALALRPIYMIGAWAPFPNYVIYYNLDWVQQGAKLCVGLVQDWVTLELSVRIRTDNGDHKI